MNPVDFTTAVSTIKAFGSFFSAIQKAKVDNAIQMQAASHLADLFALQSTLIELQTAYHDALTENRELKEKLAEVSDWTEESRNYTLKEIAAGVFVYVRQGENQSSAPSMWYCTNCFQKHQLSILQREERGMYGTTYRCPNCKAPINDHTDFLPMSFA